MQDAIIVHRLSTWPSRPAQSIIKNDIRVKLARCTPAPKRLMQACPWAEGTLNEAALWGGRQDHVPCGGDRTTGKKLGPDAIVVSAIQGDRISYGKIQVPVPPFLPPL